MVGDSLDHAVSFSCDLEALKTQIITSMARGLNGRVEFNAAPFFYVRIFDQRNAANAEYRDVDRGRVVFQIKQVGPVTGCAGRQIVWIERLYVSDGPTEDDLFEMERARLVQDFTDGNGVGGNRNVVPIERRHRHERHEGGEQP